MNPTPADLPPKQHPPEIPTPPSAQEPTPQGAGEHTHTHPAAQARESTTALQTQPPPRRPWERPTASSRPPSTTQTAEEFATPQARGSNDALQAIRQGRIMQAAASAFEAAKADPLASIRGDADPYTGRDGLAPLKPLPINRESMKMLARIVKDTNDAVNAGLLSSAAKFCQSILDNPSATPEQRGYAANVARGIMANGIHAAKALDPMEVSEGLHQHAQGVEVTEGGTAKVEATYTFKVSIS